jgi:hypothetical protein
MTLERGAFIVLVDWSSGRLRWKIGTERWSWPWRWAGEA